jgi:hypothetical protein
MSLASTFAFAWCFAVDMPAARAVSDVCAVTINIPRPDCHLVAWMTKL